MLKGKWFWAVLILIAIFLISWNCSNLLEHQIRTGRNSSGSDEVGSD